jgi:hypothetical protein
LNRGLGWDHAVQEVDCSFIFGAFGVGIGSGVMITSNEYMSILFLGIGFVMALYGASTRKGYQMEIKATKRDG